jgi:AcrR family transcriptional regulator
MSRVPGAYVEARTTEIRDAAMRVFVRKGINSSTMQDIASEAGLSAGAIYRYFDGKEQLVRAVFEHCREQNRELFEAVRTPGGSPFEGFFAVGRAVWDEFKEPGIRDQYAVRLAATVVASRPDDPLQLEMRGMHGEVLEQIAQFVEQIKATGEFPEDVDADSLALTMLSCVQGLRMLFVEFDGEINTEGVYDMLGRMLRGLRPTQEEV